MTVDPKKIREFFKNQILVLLSESGNVSSFLGNIFLVLGGNPGYVEALFFIIIN